LRLGGLEAVAARRWPWGPSSTPERSDSADAREGFGGMSSVPAARRADTIAGFLCAFALAISLVAVARTPALLAPVAILVGLVAARMSEAHRKLAAWTVAVATAAFVIGMSVAIATDSPLF
jgi:hypothetical protein